MSDDDHTKDGFVYMTSTPTSSSGWYDRFLEREKAERLSKYIAVDWAAGHGMIRGEVIKRAGNVIHARFKTIGV